MDYMDEMDRAPFPSCPSRPSRPFSTGASWLASWLVLTIPYACAHRQEPPAPRTSSEANAPEGNPLQEYFTQRQHRNAYGLYLPNGVKIGWRTSELGKGEVGGREVMIQETESRLPLANFAYTATGVYEIEDEGAIVRITGVLRENKDTTTFTVERHGEELVATIDLNGEKSTRRYPPSHDTLMQTVDFETWLYGERNEGDEIQLLVFDLERLTEGQSSVDETVTYTFEGRREILHNGDLVEVRSTRVRDERGEEARVEFLADGIELEHDAGIFVARLEPEPIAKKLEPGSISIAEAFRVPVDKPIGDPSEVTRLVIRIENPASFSIPASHRQRIVETLENGYRIEVLADHLTREETTLSADERAKYTRATTYIQSEHPDLVSLAEQIAADRTEPIQIVDAIRFWVNVNIVYSTSDDSSSALTVLQERRGDCTEHSVLLIALTRALAIPAREVSGLMYSGDEEMSFAWHSWAEFHDGRQWVSVDPTNMQLLVDATHIKLSDDTNEQSGNLADRLTIEIEEVEIKDADASLKGVVNQFIDFLKYNELMPQDEE
jgi:hypothetical protein